MKNYILPFHEITDEHRSSVGEKNFSVSELIRHLSPLGINIPDGFAITANAYVDFLQFNALFPQLQVTLNELNRFTFDNIQQVSTHCRESIMRGSFPASIETDIRKAYSILMARYEKNTPVAVRSSGTTLPGRISDFNGQYDTLININGAEHVMEAIKKCYASLFNDRALRYRFDECYGDLLSGISVGIQPMVRADKGSAGVAFTFDPHSESQKLIYIAGSWGLGQGEQHDRVNADEFYLSKPALREGNPSIVLSVKGLKEEMLTLGILEPTEWVKTPTSKKQQSVLTPSELELLGLWCLAIEKYYHQPIDIEWAKDGENGKLYVVQARKRKQIAPIVKGSPAWGKEKPEPANNLFYYELNELEMLHRESLDWLKQISFMKDEILFIQKLLTSVLHLSLSGANSNHLSRELKQLKDLHIDLLHHQIIEHEQWLADIIRTDTMGRQVAYREVHAELSDKMTAYYKTLIQLRHDIFTLVNTYIKTKVKVEKPR
jgi:phosphoenolpyruvate synthase/pyruvate phosphate dikinase